MRVLTGKYFIRHEIFFVLASSQRPLSMKKGAKQEGTHIPKEARNLCSLGFPGGQDGSKCRGQLETEATNTAFCRSIPC